MKTAMYGVDDVGGYFGGRLMYARAVVHLIARDEYLAVLHERTASDSGQEV